MGIKTPIKVRTPLRCMVIINETAKKQTGKKYRIALLTDSYQYIEIEMRLHGNGVNTETYRKCFELFYEYQLTSATEIIVSADLDYHDQILMYLDILKQQMRFKIKHFDPHHVISRICAYHTSYLNKKSKQIKEHDTQIVWNKMIENQVCPWINEQVELQIRDRPDCLWRTRNYRKKQFARIAVYYVLVKTMLYRNFLKYSTKNKPQTNDSNENL